MNGIWLNFDNVFKRILTMDILDEIWAMEDICTIVRGNVYFNSDGNQGNNFDFWEKS